MAQITKLFTKGLDTDTAPHLQEKESYSSAMNVHVAMNGVKGTSDGEASGMEFYNEGGNDGIVQLIDGNTDFSGLFGGFVNNVIIDTPGSGYGPLSPVVIFDPPPPGGTQAEGYGTFNISTGAVTGVVITNPGSGYITAPNVTILPPVSGVQATAHCTIYESPVYNKSNIETLGYTVDDTQSVNQKRTIYLFQREYDPGAIEVTYNSFISKVVIDYDSTAKRNLPVSYETVLNGQWVEATNSFNDGLEFQYHSFIIPRISNKLLIWTDGINPIRYVNVTKDYSVYNPNLLTQNELSLITEPGHVPLTSVRGSNTLKSTIIQKKSLQFTYRITNTDDFFSVLAPYSLTSLPPYSEEIAINSYAKNIINISLSKEQKIPDNWQTIEFVVRDIETNVFQIIRKFDKDDLTLREYDFGLGPVYYTDAQLVYEHNNGPFVVPYITYQNFDGTDIISTLGSDYTSKQFDAVPITAQALELASNRLLLGNIVEGYDTPSTLPNIPQPVLTQSYTTSLTSKGLSGPFIIMIKQDSSDIWCWCVVAQDTTTKKVYLYPRDMSIGTFNNSVIPGMITGPGGAPIWVNNTFTWQSYNKFFTIPQNVSFDSMIPLDTFGYTVTISGQNSYYVSPSTQTSFYSQIMSQANTQYSGQWDTYAFGGNYSVIMVLPWLSSNTGYTNVINLSTVVNSAPFNNDRAFFPNSAMNYGIQYYDEALRKSGVQELGEIIVPEYYPNTRTLYRGLQFNTSGIQPATSVPDWAKYYAITLSKNTVAENFISFMPDVIRFAYQDINKVIVYDQDETTTQLKYYGLAIPLTSLIRDGLGYTYKDNDICRFTLWDVTTNTTQAYTLSILSQQDGYIIVNADQTLFKNYISLQTDKIFVQLHNTGATPYYNRAIQNSEALGWVPEYRSQSVIIVTLYTPQSITKTLYEIAAVGPVLSPTSLGPFYNNSNSNIFTLLGSTYLQTRDGEGGALDLVSINPYQKNITLWAQDYGRITPISNVGKQTLTNTVRWSNVRIPQTKVNGLSSFDGLDAIEVDATAGPITTILQTSKESNQGARLLILCNSGSFVSLIGQSQVYSADATTALTTSGNVLGTVLPLTQSWGCISPGSVVGYKGLVFWADALNREIIAFSGNDAEPISQSKANFLWNQVFRNLPFEKEFYNSARYIKAGINPYTFEAFFTCPNPDITPKVYPGNCGLNGINQYIGNENVSYIFNWKTKTWQGAYESNPDYWVRVGDDVFTFGTQYGGNYKLLKEFDNSPGIYNQLSELKAYITFPVVPQYPSTIEPLAMMVLNQGNLDNAIIYARDSSSITNNNLTQITKVSGFTLREGELFSSVYRNRLSNNSEGALNPSVAYEEQNFNGDRIRTKAAWVQVNLFENGDPTVNNQINLQSVKLEVKESSGH